MSYMQPRYDPTIANYTPAEMERLLYMSPFSEFPQAQHYLNALQGAMDFELIRDVLENIDLDADEPKLLEEALAQLTARAEDGDKLEHIQGVVDGALTTLREHVRTAEYVKDAISQLERIE